VNEHHLTAILLLFWAMSIFVVSTLSVRGRIKTITVNGMRRRRPGESQASWSAGLRAYYPWAVSSAVSLILFAMLTFAAPAGFLYPLLAAAFFTVVVQAWPLGIWALNQAVREVENTRCRTD
jgi:hypothetical protein